MIIILFSFNHVIRKKRLKQELTKKRKKKKKQKLYPLLIWLLIIMKNLENYKRLCKITNSMFISLIGIVDW